MDVPLMGAEAMPALSERVAAIVVDDRLIPSDTKGIALHLRRKHLPGQAPFTAERTVVLVHGATYASGSLFDVRLGGLSFLDHLALAGFDVYALDVRGYGGSTRPAEMDAPADQHPPLAGTAVGMRDLASTIDHVCSETGVERVNLIAMSWGGTVAGAYAGLHPERLVRLALVAPQWLREGSNPIDTGGILGAYRAIAVTDTEAAWLVAAPEARRHDLLPEGWFEHWAAETLASDPLSGTTGTMRAVNGPIQDIRDYWDKGRPFYDPSTIMVPVLLVHAEWDADVPIAAALAFFRELRGAPYRRWVEIGEGTHRVLLEKNRLQAFQAISGFLSEDEPF